MGLQARWIDMFADVFGLCGVAPGDACTVAGLMHAPEQPQILAGGLQGRRRVLPATALPGPLNPPNRSPQGDRPCISPATPAN